MFDCISIALFAFCVNGFVSGELILSRGLRQGCSLSPYFSYFVQKHSLRLLKLLSKITNWLRWLVHGVTLELVAPFFFLHMTIIFARAKESDYRVLQNILEEYERALGQKINLTK